MKTIIFIFVLMSILFLFSFSNSHCGFVQCNLSALRPERLLELVAYKLGIAES